MCPSCFDIVNTIDTILLCAYFIKLRGHVHRDEGQDEPYCFWRSKVMVTMDIYGNKLVNTIETSAIVRGWTLLIL